MGPLNRLSVAAALVAVLAAGCGGSTPASKTSKTSNATVSATAYVTTLCTAVAPFEKEVVSGAKALNAIRSSSASSDKAALVSYFGALATDSSVAASKLDGAGVPAVSGGSAFATAIRTTFTRVSAALSRSETLVSNLPTSSAAAFRTGANKLAAAVKSSLGTLGAGLSTQKNQALNQAAAKVSACHTL